MWEPFIPIISLAPNLQGSADSYVRGKISSATRAWVFQYQVCSGKDKLMSIHGCPPLPEAGIFLPDNTIIDLAQYAKSLSRAAIDMENVQVFE